MNSTETTPAPAAGGRQVGQLLAGRYRLGMFKGGDDIADVWHALDETTETVVTLEILRDRDNEAARQRFLAEAQRMAAIERPSVMRVAAIHNEASGTFIVFEHLIPLPVVLTGLTGVAKDTKSAPVAADERAALLTPPPPQAPPSVVPSPIASLVAKISASTSDLGASEPVAPTIVDLDRPAAPADAPTEALQPVSTSLRDARSDIAGLPGPVGRVVAETQQLLRDLRKDLTDAVGEIGIDTSALQPLVARISAGVRSLAGAASSARAAAEGVSAVRMPSMRTPSVSMPSLRMPSLRMPSPRVSSVRAARPVKSEGATDGTAMSTISATAAVVLQTGASVAARLWTVSRPLVMRARGNQIVMGIVVGSLLLIAFVASPLDDAVVSALRTNPLSPVSTAAQGGLQPAPFELPPLSAYGAAFESQGAYPTATPSATVEWVVALRNTGSVGWYRGIEGAQAALALSDGTGVAVQSTPYVAPGQIGWFVVHFRARSEPGTYNVPLVPRIDGRGPLPDLGIYAVVTVAKNP